MVKIRGHREHIRNVQQIAGPDMIREVGTALYVAGDIIKAEAQHSITAGSVSGKGHVPSLPGQPPNNDTGVLARNIETAKTGPLAVEVSSNAPYATALEFGTSVMAERPYLRPAVEKTRNEVVETIRKGVARAIRRAQS